MANGAFDFQEGESGRAPRQVAPALFDAGCQGVGAAAGIAVHVAALDWQAIADELTAPGYAIVPGLLSAPACAAVAAQYGQAQLFRSRVVMEQHGFGAGEYQYFRYPLPSVVAALRQSLYGPLAAIANRWHAVLDMISPSASRRTTPSSWRAAMAPARPGPRRCCCNTAPATITACTRISMANTYFRCRRRCCSVNPGTILTAESSC